MPSFIIYFTSFLLFLATAPLPYGYYVLLRIIVTIICVWASLISFQRKNEILPWVFLFIAIIYNPIIKIYLLKEWWSIIDICIGVFLLFIKNKIKENS